MSIKQKLIILLLAIGLAPLITVAAVAYSTINAELRATTANQLESIAAKQEQVLNSEIQGDQEEVSKLANQFDFQVALGDYLKSKSRTAISSIENILQDKSIEFPQIQYIYVTDFDGRVIASTVAGTEGQLIGDFALPGGQSSSISIRKDQRDNLTKLYITARVSVNKQPAALATVVFRIDEIIAAVQDYTGLGDTGETVLSAKNSRGDSVSLLPLRFDTDAALQRNLDSLNLFGGGQGSLKEVIDYRGQTVLSTTRQVGPIGWMLATKIDSSEALAPITRLRAALISIIVLSALVIVLIALAFTRYFTNPILDMGRVAKRIGTGDLGARANIDRGDELGQLAGSINSMGYNLSDLVVSIDSQRSRLEVILNSTTEGILAINELGVIVLANQAAAAMAGLPVSELTGRKISDIYVWRRDMQPFDVNYTASGTRTFPDLQYPSPSGETRFVKLIVTEVKGGRAKEAAQAIVTIHDETKSRELETMKMDFVSMAAHELRTPLAAIKGYLELITYQRNTNDAGKVEEYIKQALKSSAELGGLINNLLNVTRIERGTLAFNIEKLDLAEMVGQAVKDARFPAEDKHITLSYHGPGKDCLVAGDRIALREVIDNLISNSINYTDANGKVSVIIETRTSWPDVYSGMSSRDVGFKVSVSDTGIGIPSSAMGNLFTKFYRAHGGLSSGNPGTGLGLYISKSIVERHQGTIGVKSKEGVGSTFYFTLPAWSDERAKALQGGELAAEAKGAFNEQS